MHGYEIQPSLKKKLERISKKDKRLYMRILNKINEIINFESIEHYKNLRYDMKYSQRVHFGHFVLVFSYDKSKDLVSFEDFDHHDNIYDK